MVDIGVWNGDNLEEMIEVCGINSVVYDTDEQTLYIYTDLGLVPVSIGTIVRYTKNGIIIED